MASIKEIRTHIKSVEQTLKITNAMYLISSFNLRKAPASPLSPVMTMKPVFCLSGGIPGRLSKKRW